jgi:hypothetical protein
MTKFKAKLFFVFTVTMFAIASFLLAVFNYNPFKADYSVFVLFYISLFASITGLSTFVVIFIKSRFSPKIDPSSFWPSLRISALISLVLVLLLLLQGLKILDLWVGVPLSLAVLLLELFFRGNKFKKKYES